MPFHLKLRPTSDRKSANKNDEEFGKKKMNH